MKRTLMLATLTFATTFGTIAAAQAPGGKANFIPNHPSQKMGVSDRQDDRWDLKKIESLQTRLTIAQKKRVVNRQELASLDAEIRQYLAAELRETRQELAEANADLKDTRYGKDYRGAVVQAKAEQRVQRKNLQQVTAIDKKMQKLYGRYDARSLMEKGKLIDELVVLARAEVREGLRR